MNRFLTCFIVADRTFIFSVCQPDTQVECMYTVAFGDLCIKYVKQLLKLEIASQACPALLPWCWLASALQRGRPPRPVLCRPWDRHRSSEEDQESRGCSHLFGLLQKGRAPNLGLWSLVPALLSLVRSLECLPSLWSPDLFCTSRLRRSQRLPSLCKSREFCSQLQKTARSQRFSGDHEEEYSICSYNIHQVLWFT